jgi:hypothetical protein
MSRARRSQRLTLDGPGTPSCFGHGPRAGGAVGTTITCAPSSAAIVPVRLSTPRCREGPNVSSALDEAFFVEHAVRRQEHFAVHMAHVRTISAERDVHRAVEQPIAPDLVEADHDIERPGGGNRGTVCVVEVSGERSGGRGHLANTALEEVAGQCRLGQAEQGRARLERVGLREQRSNAREIAGVVRLPRLELGDGQMHELRIRSHVIRITKVSGDGNRLLLPG